MHTRTGREDVRVRKTVVFFIIPRSRDPAAAVADGETEESNRRAARPVDGAVDGGARPVSTHNRISYSCGARTGKLAAPAPAKLQCSVASENTGHHLPLLYVV